MLIKNHILFIISAIFVLVHGGDAAFRFRAGADVGGVRNENYNQQQYRNTGYYQSAASKIAGVSNPGSAPGTVDEKHDDDHIKAGRGLSAWGIVAIIVGIIILGTGGYYVFVFYPYICKRERNYDMIELTNVL